MKRFVAVTLASAAVLALAQGAAAQSLVLGTSSPAAATF